MADSTIDTGLWYDYENTKKASGTTTSSTATKRTTNGDLDKDAFLNLLVTQMKYQDPLNPVDDKEFLAQMAQFSSLEQMNNMSKATEQSKAYSMIGKDIVATTFNDQSGVYEKVGGTVTAVVLKSGETYIKLGEKEIPLADVSEVIGEGADAARLDNINKNVATSQALELIGKYIQAITYNDEGEAADYVEGRVEYVKFEDGVPILVIGDKEVYGPEVISVSDENMIIGKTVSGKAFDSATNSNITVSGPIDNVNIVGEKAYVSVAGKSIQIDYISYLTEALRYVGKDITADVTTGIGASATTRAVTGVVSGVHLSGGATYLEIGNEQIEYSKIRGKVSPSIQEIEDEDSEDTE